MIVQTVDSVIHVNDHLAKSVATVGVCEMEVLAGKHVPAFLYLFALQSGCWVDTVIVPQTFDCIVESFLFCLNSLITQREMIIQSIAVKFLYGLMYCRIDNDSHA